MLHLHQTFKSTFGCFFYACNFDFNEHCQHMKRLHLIIVTALLAGCSSIPSIESRWDSAELLLNQHGWQQRLISTSTFDLMSAFPSSVTADSSLTVYIEGDGLAWITSRQPSTNPTPVNSVGLKLSINHGAGNAAYLARPCQYVVDDKCNVQYWTSNRFAPEVIEASSRAIDKLKEQFSAQQLVLVGYSGGGAVAAILAAQRDDVDKLVTVAGNLNHQAWTMFHRISQLNGSLNPDDYQTSLAKIEQVHFVGENDTVIPPFLVSDFVARLPESSSAEVIVVPGQSHGCCWESIWATLLESMN